ncbi:MAG: uL30 family ribosomal protein [Candidatus Marsarchaeota archaeon]|jgi:Ribosomal protein L30/L7E|nr:uL30 family ribosomal protein [Candidatus Marsarchaeota archaeon]
MKDKSDSSGSKLIAVVRIRGRVNVRGTIQDTMNRLHLKRVNNCAVLRMTESYKGMILKCNDYIAYGEINEDVLGKMLDRAGVKADAKSIVEGKSDAAVLHEHLPFRLHPPRHGHKNVKKGYNQGGSLGYMGPEINSLLVRMV